MDEFPSVIYITKNDDDPDEPYYTATSDRDEIGDGEVVGIYHFAEARRCQVKTSLVKLKGEDHG